MMVKNNDEVLLNAIQHLKLLTDQNLIMVILNSIMILKVMSL